MCKARSIYFICIFFLLGLGRLLSQGGFNLIPLTDGQYNQSRLFDVYTDSAFIYTIGDLIDTTIDPLNPEVRPWWGKFNFSGDLVESKVWFDENIEGSLSVFGSRILKRAQSFIYTTILYNEDLVAQTILLNIDDQSGDIKNYKIIKNPFDSTKYISPRWFAIDDRDSIGFIFSTALEVANYPKVSFFITDTLLNLVDTIIVEDNDRNNYLYYFESDSDSTYLIIGESWKRNDFSNSPDVKPYFMRINKEGEIMVFKLATGLLSETVLFGSSENYSVTKDDHDNWIFSTINYYITGQGNQAYYTLPCVYSFDRDFTQMNWAKEFPEDKYDTEQRNHVMSGAYNFMNNTYITIGNNSNRDSKASYIFNIDDNGDSLWLRHFIPLSLDSEDVNWAILEDIDVSGNNSYISLGAVSDKITSNWRSWIMYIDSFGCIVPGCQIVSNNDEVKDEELDYFKIYPNPTRSFFALLFKLSIREEVKIFIYNNTGSLMSSEIFSANKGYHYIFDVSNFVSGNYYVILKDSNNRVLQQSPLYIP